MALSKLLNLSGLSMFSSTRGSQHPRRQQVVWTGRQACEALGEPVSGSALGKRAAHCGEPASLSPTPSPGGNIFLPQLEPDGTWHLLLVQELPWCTPALPAVPLPQLSRGLCILHSLGRGWGRRGSPPFLRTTLGQGTVGPAVPYREEGREEGER